MKFLQGLSYIYLGPDNLSLKNKKIYRACSDTCITLDNNENYYVPDGMREHFRELPSEGQSVIKEAAAQAIERNPADKRAELLTVAQLSDDWLMRNGNFAGTDEERFKAITQDMFYTFVNKNHDYGNAFEEACNEEGITNARCEIRRKWNRFKVLSKGAQALVKDESIRDTLKDMANYCILTMMWIDKHKKEHDNRQNNKQQ